ERDPALQAQLAGAEPLDGDLPVEELALEPEEDQELTPDEAALLDKVDQIHGGSSGSLRGESGRLEHRERTLVLLGEAEARGGGEGALGHEVEPEGGLEELDEDFVEARRLVPEAHDAGVQVPREVDDLHHRDELLAEPARDHGGEFLLLALAELVATAAG